MILYHFTSPERLAMIQLDGILRTGESNVSPIPHSGPDVVWLTDVPEPNTTALAIATVDGTDKTAVHITVDVDDAVWWPDFAVRHHVDRRWRRALERNRDPESWWVVERPIALRETVAVEVRAQA